MATMMNDDSGSWTPKEGAPKPCLVVQGHYYPRDLKELIPQHLYQDSGGHDAVCPCIGLWETEQVRGERK